MLIFREFFNTQSDQNILQNAPNRTTFQNFLKGASIMPLNSPAYACNYNWFVFLHENSHFFQDYFKIHTKTHQS